MDNSNIKEIKKDALPEDIPVQINQSDLNEQMGSMVIQIVIEQKKNKQLQEIIKDLRSQLEKK